MFSFLSFVFFFPYNSIHSFDKYDLIHGAGTLFYPNGNRYELEFEHDERVGQGTFFLANGEKYEGNLDDFDYEDGMFKFSK